MSKRTHIEQLNGYFNNIKPSPKFGILTNGVQYKFYGSFDDNNRLDDTLCFEFDITTDTGNNPKLSKLYEILADLNEEKAQQEKTYTGTREFIEEHIFNNLTDTFVKEGILRVAKESSIILHEGQSITDSDVARVKPVVKKIFEDIIQEKVQAGLQKAIESNNPQPAEQESNNNAYEFTEDERNGLTTIKVIAKSVEGFDIERITADDKKGFCNIIVDGDKRKKKVCVLHFNNSSNLFLVINEKEYKINSPLDIEQYKDELTEIIKSYI